MRNATASSWSSSTWLSWIVINFVCHRVMVLVNVSILPHGTMLLDLAMPDLPEGVKELNNACFLAGQTLVDSSPDTIILFSPHGISIRTKPGVYLNSKVSGTAGWNGFWETYSACGECDSSIAKELLTFLNKDEDVGAAGITSFTSGCAAPLAWGEVVPLQFCSSSLHSGSQVVVCSWPQARFKPVSYGPSALATGQRLYEFASDHSKRIALLFSCDMAHVHGVRPEMKEMFKGDPELGVNKPLAQHFDAQILSWVGHLIAGEPSAAKEVLLGEDTLGIVEGAKCCGWAGFCAVQGVLQALAEHKGKQSSPTAGLQNSVGADAAVTASEAVSSALPTELHWRGKLWGYGAPTYFGMMAVTFDIYN